MQSVAALTTMHLLDTDVLWDLRSSGAGSAVGAVARWAGTVQPASVFVSALSLIELTAAATDLARRDRAGGARAQAWLDRQVVPAFAGRILPIDAPAVARWGQLRLPFHEGMMVATALDRALTLATYDVAAYKPAKLRTFDPRTYARPASDAREDWRQAAQTGPLWLKSLFTRA